MLSIIALTLLLIAGLRLSNMLSIIALTLLLIAGLRLSNMFSIIAQGTALSVAAVNTLPSEGTGST